MTGPPATDRASTAAAIRRDRIVAILRCGSAQEALAAAAAVLEGGIRVLEVALTTPDGLEAVEELSRTAPESAVVGAGTVLDADTAQRALDAGARFLVSPALLPEVVEFCHRHDAVALPGAYTPTELVAAARTGADFVKLFPASSLGPSYLTAVRAALPQLAVVPTGGVDADNARSWLAAGAAAVGVGGALSHRPQPGHRCPRPGARPGCGVIVLVVWPAN